MNINVYKIACTWIFVNSTYTFLTNKMQSFKSKWISVPDFKVLNFIIYRLLNEIKKTATEELLKSHTMRPHTTMNYFLHVVKHTPGTKFWMVNTAYYDNNLISYEHFATETRDDIQILYDIEAKHCICIFYSCGSNLVSVYDSLLHRRLTPHEWNIIKKLYPKIVSQD